MSGLTVTWGPPSPPPAPHIFHQHGRNWQLSGMTLTSLPPSHLFPGFLHQLGWEKSSEQRDPREENHLQYPIPTEAKEMVTSQDTFKLWKWASLHESQDSLLTFTQHATVTSDQFPSEEVHLETEGNHVTFLYLHIKKYRSIWESGTSSGTKV